MEDWQQKVRGAQIYSCIVWVALSASISITRKRSEAAGIYVATVWVNVHPQGVNLQ